MMLHGHPFTSVSPAKHGRYFYHAIIPKTYRLPFWNDNNLKRVPFWDDLSKSRFRLAVIDVPKCPLSSEINGVHLTDWRVHGRDHSTASNPVHRS